MKATKKTKAATKTKSAKPDLVVKRFRSPAAWEKWLEKHHESSPGVWLEFAKKESGLTTVSYKEALEVALCYGWIDGLVAGVDAKVYRQRFTPRRASQQVVADQPGGGGAAARRGTAGAGGRAADGGSATGRPLGRGVPIAQPDASAGGLPAALEQYPERSAVLRGTEQPEPLRHSVPAARRQAAGDPGRAGWRSSSGC